MGYFSSNDYELCYNEGNVNNIISNLYSLISKLERYRLHMIDDVTTLERHAHDVEATIIDEDYKDYEYLLNNDGLLTFELELKQFLANLESQMDSYEKTTNANYQRREEERRRKEEEERRKREEEAKQQEKKTSETVTRYKWR